MNIRRSGRGIHHGGRSRVWGVHGPVARSATKGYVRKCSDAHVEAIPVSAAATRRTVVTLGGTEVFARSRGSRTSASRLLDAESPALVDLALKSVLCCVRILGADHLHESKATALAGVRVTHDVALLDSAMLLEENGDLFLGQARVDASDEQVGAFVDVARLTAARGLTLTAITVAAAILAGRGNVAARSSARCQAVCLLEI